MTADILEMAHRAGLRVGATVNVLLFSEGGHTSSHTLTSVAMDSRDSVDRLLMRWTPGETTPWGTTSCGFAGYEINDRLRARLADLATQTGSGNADR